MGEPLGRALPALEDSPHYPRHPCKQVGIKDRLRDIADLLSQRTTLCLIYSWPFILCTAHEMSPRVELARRVLEAIASGRHVSTLDAFQLRNWALRAEDCMLPLVEIAISILAHDEGETPEKPEASH